MGLVGLLVCSVACSNGAKEHDAGQATTQQAIVGITTVDLEAAPYSFTLPVFHRLPELEPAIITTDSFSVGSRAVILSESGQRAVLANAGMASSMVEPDTQVGSLWSRGGVELRDRVHVLGDVRAPELHKTNNGIEIDGDQPPGTAPEMKPSLQFTGEYPAAAQAKSYSLEPADSIALEPARYGGLRLAPNSRANLQSGTYYFDSLELESEAKLMVDSSTGPEGARATCLWCTLARAPYS